MIAAGCSYDPVENDTSQTDTGPATSLSDTLNNANAAASEPEDGDAAPDEASDDSADTGG